ARGVTGNAAAGTAMIRTLDARALGFDAVVRALERPPDAVAPEIHRAVDEILAAVRARGDEALLEYTARFDAFRPPAAAGLAAAKIAGVTEGWRIGGAQAVAALAYGTAAIRRVDKIVGPGNIYVALAKARVFGEVGIDMVAGPSEVIVVADGAADPAWVAADLLAQAEHDPMARALCITDSAELLQRVARALEGRLAALPRRDIAGPALEANGALIRV